MKRRALMFSALVVTAAVGVVASPAAASTPGDAPDSGQQCQVLLTTHPPRVSVDDCPPYEWLTEMLQGCEVSVTGNPPTVDVGDCPAYEYLAEVYRAIQELFTTCVNVTYDLTQTPPRFDIEFC